MDIRNRRSQHSLKKAMLDLMHKLDLSKITVTALCTKAKVNRSTFYANYESIYALLNDIYHDLFLEMQATLEKENYDIYHELIGEQANKERYHFLLSVVEFFEKKKELIQLFIKQDTEHLFEKQLSEFFFNIYVKEKGHYLQEYVFIYHSMAALTIIQRYYQQNCPCTKEELARILWTMSQSALMDTQVDK